MFVLLKNVMYTGLEWGGELLEIIEILCDYDVIVPWLRSLSLSLSPGYRNIYLF